MTDVIKIERYCICTRCYYFEPDEDPTAYGRCYRNPGYQIQVKDGFCGEWRARTVEIEKEHSKLCMDREEEFYD